jgi:hypothetical protein
MDALHVFLLSLTPLQLLCFYAVLVPIGGIIGGFIGIALSSIIDG